MHKITNLWKFELNWWSKLRDMKKTPLSHGVVCFQMLDFETSNSKSEVSKSNLWKITSFSKTTSLQMEPFLTMYFTINSSPLLVTKLDYSPIIILSKLPIVSTAFRELFFNLKTASDSLLGIWPWFHMNVHFLLCNVWSDSNIKGRTYWL